MKKLAMSQFIILLIGTLFAWTNFGLELVNWLNDQECDLGCLLIATTNPFMTACFYGALFFTLAFIISAIILKKIK